ncbi:hypothetical protein CPLU01_12059 [Colletotrichum plurivorum]|uniref:Uncharacterized protein n=1 Tax=Colletotrichum plurivorum TaxID=2175906 RepID=A0A8H6N6P7_9PEZI|nr:hypothetical protein CPLU01_12059 [Colletotrichum plurivorum]
MRRKEKSRRQAGSLALAERRFILSCPGRHRGTRPEGTTKRTDAGAQASRSPSSVRRRKTVQACTRPRGVEGQDKRHRQEGVVLVLVLVLVPSSANCRNVAVIQQQMGSQAANLASQKSVPVEAAVDESLMNSKPSTVE